MQPPVHTIVVSLATMHANIQRPAELMGEFFERFDLGLEEVQMAA